MSKMTKRIINNVISSKWYYVEDFLPSDKREVVVYDVSGKMFFARFDYNKNNWMAQLYVTTEIIPYEQILYWRERPGEPLTFIGN